MINKVIKSEKEAAKVAKALAKDLRECLDVFKSYEVSVEPHHMQYYVTVTSPEGSCNILTGSCINNMMLVVKMYELQYAKTSYHMDVVKQGDKYLPAFIICVNYEKE